MAKTTPEHSSGETNVYGIRLDEPFAATDLYLNYELSLLDFNRRVLAEAQEPGRNPLLERVRYLAITASNLDEFFQKRVGGLKRQVYGNVTTPSVDGRLPSEQLARIRREVNELMHEMNNLWLNDLLPSLAAAGVHIKTYDQLNAQERSRADAYFHDHLFPILTPLAVDPGHPFPFISNLSLSLGVELKDKEGAWHFARVKVPPVRPRFVRLDNNLGQQQDIIMVPIEQIISANIESLFTGMQVVSVAAFRITRNAEVEELEQDAEDLLELIAEELRHRKYAPVVRLQVDRDLSPQLKDLLIEELEIHEDDVYASEGFLGLASLHEIADLPGLAEHRQAAWKPKTHTIISLSAGKDDSVDMFTLLRSGELLVHHPYQSFETSVVSFVRQASRDPKVLTIKQTLYRTSEDSEILRALVEAAESGKQVAVLVELKARFDEARNIELAQRLEAAGVHVTYGLLGLKTHCKTTLVVREEDGIIRRYFHIGTGNYNPVTAKLYEDIGLLSSDPEIAEDLTRLFNYLTGYAPDQSYERLLVAPKYLRQRFLELIDAEIEHARAGRVARIIAKVNNLEDPQIIQRLYQASQAGVEIDLIVRSVCRLIPGRAGISDRIRVRSIVGRFLEHSRIYYFHAGGSEVYLFGSADWMRRNLDRRVEVLAPITAPPLKAYLAYYLDVLLRDTQQSWILDDSGRYTPLRHSRSDGFSCHAEMMEHTERRRSPIGWHPYGDAAGPDHS